MADLTCPKCQSAMRSYERNGVTVDQCSGCRGVFLDRGELERLIDAEASYYDQAQPSQAQPSRAPEPPPQEQPRREKGFDIEDMAERMLGGKRHQSHGSGHGHGKHRKRKSFLDELFD